MDSTRRISDSGRLVYSTSKQPKVNQTKQAVVSVSEDRSVSDEQRDKVGGVAADRKANLGRFKELLEGKSLPAMTQLMGGQKSEEESAARKALEKPDLQENSAAQGTEAQKSEKDGSDKKTGEVSKEKGADGQELSEQDSKEVQKLKQRDREVRAHEQAHVAAGGQYVRGGIKYEYQRGPDGRSYAVGGHVNIDVSEAETPEATITKMQQVKRAALAPAEPSGADRAVAAAASQKEQQARTEILEQRQEDVAQRRAEVADKGESTRSTQGREETSNASGIDESLQVKAEDTPAPEPPKIEAPDIKTQMNLAREARMRIKRGDYWEA